MRTPKILTTMRDYSWKLFISDLWAGISVAMVALPLSIAIAIASGATPAQGLFTAIIGGVFVSLLGGSRVQIGGPTGAFIVVVHSVINQHGYDGLLIATFFAGIILVIAGLFRAGRLIALVPEMVISGFTIGIAIIIATSQINDFAGMNIANLPAEFFEKIKILAQAMPAINSTALVLGAVSLLMLIVFRKLAPSGPGLIAAVVLTSIVCVVFALPVETIATKFGDLPSQLPLPGLPQTTFSQIVEVLPSAFIIAFLAGVESLLSAMVADKMIDGHHRPNAELTAQGFANIASTFFGGMPVTGAIARTATNVSVGGKTPVAGIIHALTILLIVMFAASWISLIPMTVLSALLILTAWNMSEPSKWGDYLRASKSDKFLLITTLTLTVVADLTVAIAVGVALGLAIKMLKSNKTDSDWSAPDR